jgi:hypothetical protein
MLTAGAAPHRGVDCRPSGNTLFSEYSIGIFNLTPKVRKKQLMLEYFCVLSLTFPPSHPKVPVALQGTSLRNVLPLEKEWRLEELVSMGLSNSVWSVSACVRW